MFGALPAYGFYIRHAKGIQLNDVQVSFINPDTRPALMLDDVQGVYINHLSAQKAAGSNTIILKNVSDLSIHQTPGIKDQEVKELVAEKVL